MTESAACPDSGLSQSSRPLTRRHALRSTLGWTGAAVLSSSAGRAAGFTSPNERPTIAAIGTGTRGGEAWAAAVRDAEKHRSINAGWPEAAMAGALGIALAGPRRYRDLIVDDAWMNDGARTDASAADIHRTLSLYRKAGAGLAALLLLAMVLI